MAATSSGAGAGTALEFDGCGLWRRSVTRGLILTGEDRQRLLNGLVTCEVKILQPGQGAMGFFTDAKGHILSPVVVRVAVDHLWLELPEEMVVSIADHIEKYIVADRVEVSSSAAAVPLTLVGPAAGELVEEFLAEQEAPGSEWGHVEVEAAGVPLQLSRGRDLGFPALTLWVPEDSLVEVSAALEAARVSQSWAEVDSALIDQLRIESGAPRFRVDYDTDNLPQETGLDEAVSYSKGCFLGQEVIARLHYRGQTARQVVKLEIEAQDPPAVGTRVLLADRQAGRLTSVASSAGSGRVAALAMLRRRAIEPGTELDLEGGGRAWVV